MRDRKWIPTSLALATVLLTVAALIPLGGCIVRTRAPAARVTVATPPPPTAVVTAQPVAVGAVGNGTITHPGHALTYPISITHPRTIQIYVEGHGLDPIVTVTDAVGRQIGRDDDGGNGLDSRLVLTLGPGNYNITVTGYSSSTGSFSLSVN